MATRLARSSQDAQTTIQEQIKTEGKRKRKFQTRPNGKRRLQQPGWITTTLATILCLINNGYHIARGSAYQDVIGTNPEGHWYGTDSTRLEIPLTSHWARDHSGGRGIPTTEGRKQRTDDQVGLTAFGDSAEGHYKVAGRTRPAQISLEEVPGADRPGIRDPAEEVPGESCWHQRGPEEGRGRSYRSKALVTDGCQVDIRANGSQRRDRRAHADRTTCCGTSEGTKCLSQEEIDDRRRFDYSRLLGEEATTRSGVDLGRGRREERKDAFSLGRYPSRESDGDATRPRFFRLVEKFEYNPQDAINEELVERKLEILNVGEQEVQPCNHRYAPSTERCYHEDQAHYVALLMHHEVAAQVLPEAQLQSSSSFHEDYWDATLSEMQQNNTNRQRLALQGSSPGTMTPPPLQKPDGDDGLNGQDAGAVDWIHRPLPVYTQGQRREEVWIWLQSASVEPINQVPPPGIAELSRVPLLTYGFFHERDCGQRPVLIPAASSSQWMRLIREAWHDVAIDDQLEIVYIDPQPEGDDDSIHLLVTPRPLLPSQPIIVVETTDTLRPTRRLSRVQTPTTKFGVLIGMGFPDTLLGSSILKYKGRIVGRGETFPLITGQLWRALFDDTPDLFLLQRAATVRTGETTKAIITFAGGSGDPYGDGPPSDDSGMDGDEDDGSGDEGRDDDGDEGSEEESSGSEFDPGSYGWDDELPPGLVRIACFRKSAEEPILSIVSMRSQDELFDHLATLWRIPAQHIRNIIHVHPEPAFATQHRAWPIIMEQVNDRRNPQVERLVVLQIEYYHSLTHSPEGEIGTEWRVVRLPPFAMRHQVLLASVAINYCEAIVDGRCLVWHHDVLWPQQGEGHFIRDGDLLRIAIPPIDEEMPDSTWLCVQDAYDAGRTIGFPYSPTSARDDVSEASEITGLLDSSWGMPSDLSTSSPSNERHPTDGHSSVLQIPLHGNVAFSGAEAYCSPAPGLDHVDHAGNQLDSQPQPLQLSEPDSVLSWRLSDSAGRLGSPAGSALQPSPFLAAQALAQEKERGKDLSNPTPISLANSIGDHFNPIWQNPTQPNLCGCTQSGLDFGEVWRLLEWLDAATISPSWLLPEGREWHSATEPWIDNEWWSLQTPLELWFYTDGSCTPNGAGSAVVLFVKSAFGWHYGGYVAQKCHKQCAHFAELQALVMGFHWLHGLLTFCAVMGSPPPMVTFAFDATSAGYKAFGFWGGQQYQHETANIRSIWQWIVSKFNFHWTTNHTAAHQGDPGNEAANSAAQAAAWSTNDLRSYSTWGHYVMLTRDIELHWLWACWKREWKDYWKGTTLHLPVRPDTAPSPVVLGLCEQTADVNTAGCEPTELKCCFATANVLTLMPGPKKHQEHGVQGRTRTEYLQRLFTENQVHVVGLQETRMRKTARTVADDYFVFSGCATSRGHFGTQLWFSRVLPLDKEGHCFFQKEHFKIIHQDPRSLCVRVLAPFAKMIVISGHAPHSQASEDDKVRWWNELCNITPARYKDWPHFLLIDANARVGEYSNELIGDFEADSHDANGTYFSDYLAQCGMWLPSTFENIHSGDSGTWWHQQGEKWLRGDYVCLPTQIPFTFCESKVLDNIDLSLLKDDHRPVSATVKWQAVNNKVEKLAAWTQTKFDSHAIKNVLSGPNGLQQLQALREFVPSCDWSVDVHSHMAWLQHGLRSWAKQTCKAEGPKPHKKTLSEETWQLILQKRETRKQHFASKKHFDRLKLACLFKRWQGARVEWPHETKEESHAAALNLAKFIVLGKQVTQAVRADDKRYFEELTASMGHPLDTHVGPDTWKKIRWALPKLQQKRKQSPILLEELDSQWLNHFSELEAGHEIEINGLVDKCHSRQLTRPHARQLQLSDLPTLGEVEATLRATQPHRAPGPDCLPGSLFRYGATSIAVGVHDVYAKTIAWEAEAVQNKGGIMVPIHKAGTLGQACHYRGIMLLNTLAKGLHAIMRRRIMKHLEPVRLTSQLGGFQFQQAQFGAQCVQTLARVCAARGLSHCTLFVDVKGAYHYLIRELVLGIESHEDFDEVLKHLTKQKIDNKGVKLWSGLPGLLERIHADPKLISTLRELHCDTWASLPQGTMRSRRGSRPGSPIADAIFHALMLDIHIEVHRVIEDDTEACQGFKIAELPVCAVTWADDLAVPLIAETATDLVPLVQRITRKLILTFEQRGLTLNLARNKTAAVLSFKGPHATTMRREHLLKSAPGCQIKVNENRCEWLHFTGTYKHLGSIFCADGDMKREVTSRIGAASRTFSTLRKNIFNNKQLAVRVRLQLLDALVLSQLFYGISTWSALGAGLVEKVDSFVLNCQRLICGVDRATTHDAFRGIYQLPRTDTRLAASRLLYAAKAWTHGPDILRQLLAKEDEVCDASWLGALRLDLKWCADIAGDRIPQEWSLDDVDVLAPFWRDHPRKWNALVKKMYKSGILQEAIAAEARGWHHLILADLQSTGGKVVGAPGKPPDGTHRCHCGKMCKSAQGLSAHKWQVHQERAPESKFLESPCCPVCMRWFWTTHRLRMHLSYIPRNGQANPCFRALSCSTFRANTQEEGEIYAVPQELKGMRLDSLACEGPMKPLLRRVDGELDEVNDEIKDTEEKLADYPSEEDIDIALVEKVSCAFSECTRQTLQEGGQTVDLINRWAACLGDLWTDEDEAAIEVVFTAWGREVMHDIALSADDCFGGAYADEAFYETVKDLDYPRLVTRQHQLQARLRHLQQIRLDEDQAPPHRAVRQGPRFRRGGNKKLQGALRLYADGDGWDKACHAMDWHQAPPERYMPMYRTPEGRRCFIILHLFAGRRRDGDYHDELARLSSAEDFDLRVLSFDTAINAKLGDLSATSQSWKNIDTLLRKGYVAGAMAGSPCETFTEARYYIPEDVEEKDRKRWPRPLRDTASPWGREFLTHREMRQLKVGSAFALQVVWTFAMLLIYGGHMFVEHPAPPKALDRASIFRLPIVALLLKLPETRLRIILQKDWGATSVKPTGFLVLRAPSFITSMRRWMSPSATTSPAIGKENGTFKTAALKEYPRALSKGLAQSTIDAVKLKIRRGQIRSYDVNEFPPGLGSWCEEVVNAVSATSYMMPDYQGAAKVF